jgi:hypothetical protein
MDEIQCYECGKTIDETTLTKCPTCFKYFCGEHSFVMSGRPFCSRGCADYFFFGDPDD